MIIAVLAVLGICFGSFVNALVWRLHEADHEAEKKKPNKKYLKELSITTGRSMCPDCHHTLAGKDLIPVLSWLSLGGKCRYCRKPISWQYPLVEAVTAGLFVISYMYWPNPFTAAQITIFTAWLTILIGFMALVIYDLRWYLLPNRIVYPLTALAGLVAVVDIASAGRPAHALLDTALSVAVAGGIFYVLFQVSQGKWIGGGDVKLGWVIGLVLGTPSKSILMLFFAAIAGTLVSLPLLAIKKVKSDSHIPFGPFLIVATVVVQLFGATILAWYQRTFLLV